MNEEIKEKSITIEEKIAEDIKSFAMRWNLSCSKRVPYEFINALIKHLMEETL